MYGSKRKMVLIVAVSMIGILFGITSSKPLVVPSTPGEGRGVNLIFEQEGVLQFTPIRVWDTYFDIPAGCEEVYYSDGITTFPPSFEVYEVHTGENKTIYLTSILEEGTVYSLEISPDNNWLAMLNTHSYGRGVVVMGIGASFGHARFVYDHPEASSLVGYRWAKNSQSIAVELGTSNYLDIDLETGERAVISQRQWEEEYSVDEVIAQMDLEYAEDIFISVDSSGVYTTRGRWGDYFLLDLYVTCH